MNKKIYMIDHGLGNLQSILQVSIFLGIHIEIISDPDEVIKADAVILPGVGAFGEAMNNMNRSGMSDAVINFIQSGKPLIGVCLGLQLLFSESEEFGSHKGLGVIQGKVKKFDFSKVSKIPQVGWNKVSPLDNNYSNWQNTPLKNIRNNDYMYFVHSYYVEPVSKQVILAETTYNSITYSSAILKENVFAVQFHPEKSSHAGILIYKSWFDSI